MALRGTASAPGLTGTSHTINVGAIGIQPRDLILLCGTWTYTTSDPTPTWPSGFNPINGLADTALGGTGCWTGIVCKTAGPSEPSSYTVTTSASRIGSLQCRVYSGRSGVFTAVSSQPVTTVGAAPANYSIAGLTATAGDDVCCFIENSLGATPGTETFSPSAGFGNALLTNVNGNQTPPITSQDASTSQPVRRA